MDWLTLKFCVLTWVLCVSKSQSQLLNSTSSLSNQLQSSCEDGQPIVPPDQCNTCICFTGQIYCTNIPCPEQDCVNGVDLPQPDACNKCICRRGKVTCSNMICIPAPHCTEKQLYPAQNKCNACMCLSGFITCTNNLCAEEPLPSTITTTTTKKPKTKKKCVEGDSLPGPDKCIECFCRNGRKNCKYVCNPTLESRFSQEPECVPGQHIPRPDNCNSCICFEGQIHCTHLPCQMDTRLGPECTDNQLVFRPDECNECYCFEGRLKCSDLVCIRGSKCVQGQVIPKPDSCNACKCVDGYILCTNYQCPIANSRNALKPGSSPTEVRTLDECQEGDVIPPPPPPNDCNMCYCLYNRVLCTIHSCEGSDPEIIKGRLREPNEQTDLEIFDKRISVEPFINMLSKKYEKLPTKHTPAHNGFHQEIKVHASHLPNDATKLLKVLATSLDNSALANISQRLLTSSNNHDSKIPLDNQVVRTKLLVEGNVLKSQSSKLITSGSLSNETILVIPNTEPLNDQNSQSVLPLTSKHETIWKSVSSPASIVFNNNQQINPHSSQEQKLNVYYYDNPPSMFTSIEQNNLIRNTSKFSRPNLPHMLPTKPTQNTVDVPNKNTQSIYSVSNPKSITINNSKMSYAPSSQDNKQFKLIPSGFVSKRDELPHLRPYDLTNQVFNYTSLTPLFRPSKFIVTTNNNGGPQKPSQSQFIPNLSKYYPNHVKPQHIQFKPNQNHLPTLNNKGIQHPRLLPNNTNQPIVAANQYKAPQFALKPGQGIVGPFNNKGNQTDQQFKAFPSSFQINPPVTNLPNQKKRICSIANESSKEIPPHSMLPNSSDHHTNILNVPQIGADPERTQHKSSHSQFVPNPSIYYRNEYEASKIFEVNSDQEQLIPHSKISYTPIEQYNPPHTSSESGHDILIPKVRNKTRKYNTTHPHYEKHRTITYVSEYDPTDPANPLQIVHDPNQLHNTPQTIVYESQKLDLIMSKVRYYLNRQLDQNETHPKLTHYYSSQTPFLPDQRQNYTLKVYPTVTEMNKYNQHDSWNISNYQFDKYLHSPNDGKNQDPIKSYQNRSIPTNPMYHIYANYPHSLSQSQFILSQDNSKEGDLNDSETAEGPQSLSYSAEDPTHPKSNEHLHPPSQTGPTQRQHPPELFDDRGSTNGLQHEHNAYEDPRQLKPIYKLPHSKLETPQNHQLPRFFYERESADGFQNISNSAEDLTHPKAKLNKSLHFNPYISTVNPEQPTDNPHISAHSQFGPAQRQHKPVVFDNRGVENGFQYAHSADKNTTHLKPLHKLLPFTHSQTPFGPTIIQHSLGMFDERASADGFQYPSNSAENPIHSRGNLHNPKLIQFGPAQNQYLPRMFDERGSTDGFQYPSNSVENPILPKDNLQTLLQSQFLPSPNQHTSGVFDERSVGDGFQYPSNSAEKSLHPKENMNKPSNSPFGSTTLKQLPGMYPSNSAGKPTDPNNLTHPEQNIQKRPHSQVSPNHNKQTLGMFDDRALPDGFQLSCKSAGNPLHPKDSLHYPLYSKFGPPQNQHLPGVFGNRGSAGGLQYPTYSFGNPHLKDNLQNPPQSQFLPSHNQYVSEVFDDRGSASGFQNPSNLAEDFTSAHSPLGLTQNQHLPRIFDERESSDRFQYQSHSAAFCGSLQPKDNQHNPSHFQFGPTQNQRIPGVFDERGSADGFHYPSNSAEDFTHTKQNKQIQSNSPFGPAQNQHLPGMFDERGSADGFQYPSNSVENPTHPKDNLHKLPQSQFLPAPNLYTPGVFDDRGSADDFHYPSNSAEDFTHIHSPLGPTQNQHLPGMLDERESSDGFQYLSHSAENPLQPKDNDHNLPHPQFGPNQNQHTPGVFDDRGSADGFQYPSNSVENPTHPKGNLHKLPQSHFLPSPNQHTPGVFGDRGSANSFHYPSNSAEDSTHPKGKPPHTPIGPTQNQHLAGMFDERGSTDGFQYPPHSVENPLQPKDNQHNPPHPHFGPTQNQHTPGVFDDRGSTDGFYYPSNSAESPSHPKNNPNTTPEFKFKKPQNQLKPSSLDDGYNNNNPPKPWLHHDHDQNTPSSFDNLLKGVHNIPWSFSGVHNKESDTVTSAPKPRFTPDYDQYKPSSFDNLFNEIRQIPWSVPNKDNNGLGSDAEITTPSSGFKPKQGQYGPLMVNNPSISNKNENKYNNQIQIKQDVLTPSTDLTDSDSTQYNLLPKFKPDSDLDSLFPIDDGKIPDSYDQLYPLFKAVKKLSHPRIDDSVFSVGSMDQLDLLPILFPGIAESLNYESSQNEDDVSPDKNHEVQRINPLSKLKSKLKHLPENVNGILNWLKSKLNKLVTKDNATVTKNDIDMTKIFNFLSKLTLPKLKHTTALQNTPFSGFDPEIIEKIRNDFKEDSLSTTSTPRNDRTHSYENRFRSDPTVPEESRPQAPQFKYPDVHIILHQPKNEDLPPYIETEDETNLATDMDPEELSTMLPKMVNARFRHRPKDQREECGHGTQWVNNCHGCSCYFGQAMCFRLPDCNLRPLGEPMTCKPYSHFKMGCYTCECNGDGVAECDATNCNTEPTGESKVSGSTESPLPIFNEFFDRKKTNEILQYYNFYKKLPKDYPKQDLRTQYPTCERGTSWVSSCHKCECNERGKHECIKIDNCELDIESYGKPGRCKPNSKFYPKTNSMPCVECSCNDEGTSYCPGAD